MTVIEYKCPNCGSGMAFDSKTGTLACQSCGRKDDIEQIPDPLEGSVFSADGAKEYHCASCGAVIAADAETAATTCSFCGSAAVLGDRLTGERRPAKVIPFAISKDEAISAFRKWCRNGRLTPKGFMTADRIKGITGLYVPFWLYDLNSRIEVQGHGTKVNIYTRGDYRYTETAHYEVYRKIRLNHVNVPVDAAEKMSDKLMDRLEPFPYDRLKSFRSPYLAGYTADQYSYSDEELLPRAKEKISSYIEEYIRSAVAGYTTMSYTRKDTETESRQADYVHLPVWVLHYDYDKLEHTFAMNGQTGKVVGKPPLSMAKVAAWFLGIAGVSFVTLKLAAWAMGGGLW